MSIVSTMLIFVVQVVVGDIVVGRVRVEDMVYDIEPLSNCNHVNFQTQHNLIFLGTFVRKRGRQTSNELGKPPTIFPTGTNINSNPNS